MRNGAGKADRERRKENNGPEKHFLVVKMISQLLRMLKTNLRELASTPMAAHLASAHQTSTFLKAIRAISGRRPRRRTTREPCEKSLYGHVKPGRGSKRQEKTVGDKWRFKKRRGQKNSDEERARQSLEVASSGFELVHCVAKTAADVQQPDGQSRRSERKMGEHLRVQTREKDASLQLYHAAVLDRLSGCLKALGLNRR